MADPNWANQTIWTGDNLPIMRGMNSESVDLIYLDPPFNSKANYAAPIGSKAAGANFKDIWHLDDVEIQWIDMMEKEHPRLYRMLLVAMTNSDKAYLAYMAIRLLEMWRILKPTGSICLHCDPTMSHYLKLVMDSIFGRNNFINEIVWLRYAVHSLAQTGFDRVTDVILCFAKDFKKAKFNPVYGRLSEKDEKRKFPHVEKETGRRYQHVALEQSSNNQSIGEARKIQDREVHSDIGWRWSQETFDKRIKENPNIIHWTGNGRPRYKLYADDYKGQPIGSVWDDIPYLSSSSSERTGYPTQKPLALLDRVIKVFSNDGDVVLDPFCGCATACIAAERLSRKWVGIDISDKAAELISMRFEDDLGGLLFKGVHRNDLLKRTDLGKLPRYNCKENRIRLYGEQEGRCAGCKEHFESRHLEVDHYIARSKGGSDHLDNLQLLCSHCNRMKGNRGMEDLKLKLQFHQKTVQVA